MHYHEYRPPSPNYFADDAPIPSHGAQDDRLWLLRSKSEQSGRRRKGRSHSFSLSLVPCVARPVSRSAVGMIFKNCLGAFLFFYFHVFFIFVGLFLIFLVVFCSVLQSMWQAVYYCLFVCNYILLLAQALATILFRALGLFGVAVES